MQAPERHYISRTGWLRAAVLGANDGLISTASLIVGVAASSASQSQVLLAGTAGLVAGAMSMAAGEYVSVSSQADTEAADLHRERRELLHRPEYELRELAQSFENRGLRSDTARDVAEQLTEADALAAHAREELGISHEMTARPFQAALTSGVSFTAGALLPLAVGLLVPLGRVVVVVPVTSVLFLALLGAFGATLGGAPKLRAAGRVALWGTLAMAFTALVGRLFGTFV